MTNKTLSINFYAENIGKTEKAEFMSAVAHEKYGMRIQLLDDSIAKLSVKIANSNGTYTDEDVESFKTQLEGLKATRDEVSANFDETLETYNKVFTAMTEKNKDHFGNNPDVVTTVLRVLAAFNDSNLIKLAITPAFTSPALYEALETIHVNSLAGEDGNITMSKAVKEAYKSASKELESIIKTTFSLPFETAYTSKTRVKMTAEDKKLLNDCYIKGFSNKWNTDNETGVVTFGKRQINRLVKVKRDNKTDKVTYDYSGLASTIANIVLKHYFA